MSGDVQCRWKIHYGVSQEATTQCDRAPHMDETHVGPGLVPGQRIHWQAGDRREYTGDWPGPCTKLAGCTLHTGHHGRCAP